MELKKVRQVRLELKARVSQGIPEATPVERCLACEAVVSRVKTVTPPFHALHYVVSPRRSGPPHLAKTRSRNLNSACLGKQQERWIQQGLNLRRFPVRHGLASEAALHSSPYLILTSR